MNLNKHDLRKERFEELEGPVRESENFIRRKIKPSVQRSAVFSLVAFLLIITAITQLETIGIGNLITIVTCVFIAIIAYMLVHTDKISNVVFTREFENALFAGAAGKGVEFLLIIKSNRQVVYYNPSCREYFAYQPKNEEGHLDNLLKNMGLDQLDREEIDRAIATEQTARASFMSTRPYGDTQLLDLILEPIPRPYGYFVLKAVRRASGVSPVDVFSKSIVSRKAIGMLWKSFLENSPVATAIIEENGTISQGNTAFCMMIGKNEETINSEKLFDLVDNNSLKEIHIMLQKIEAGVDLYKLKPIDIKFATENKAAASLYLNPVGVIQEQPLFVACFIDTTEKKLLEGRIAQSQKMQAVGQLAGGIAHDFNNLLTAMIGFCDLLLTRHPPGEQSFADIMQIKQNANRAANLVRQLLAFSRRQTLQPAVIDITDTLIELSNLIRRLIGENINLNIEHDRNLWTVMVDQGQLEQVIINLAVNARDAMNQKGSEGGTLTIRTKNIVISKESPLEKGLVSSPHDEEIAEGEYAVIEVIDTGCGIPQGIILKIFEPFFTTKGVGEGTGLGLATVHGIVRQTGGHIYVSSEKEKGAKFSIFLKHCEEAASKKKDDSESEVRHWVQDLTGTGTILLVEDETPVRIFSSRALTNKGYTVLEADSAETALEIVKNKGKSINIVITDVVMPGMTGPAMIKEILQNYPKIKVIFISGYGEDAFVKTYGADREFNFLPKPFTLNQLASKVKDVLNST